MTFDWNTYQREYKRKQRAKAREVKRITILIQQNKCQFCEMLLSSQYHIDHPCESYKLHIQKIIVIDQPII